MTENEIALFRAINKMGGQSALASAVGVTRQAVGAWVVRGYIPDDLETIRKVAAATGIEPRRLRPDYGRVFKA